jgi:hypothetical protein
MRTRRAASTISSRDRSRRRSRRAIRGVTSAASGDFRPLFGADFGDVVGFFTPAFYLAY